MREHDILTLLQGRLIFTPSLCDTPAFAIENLCASPDVISIAEHGDCPMADVVFLALGCGLFAVLALYAAACQRL